MAKILILHATVGTGHKTAAAALETAFKQLGDHTVWVQDTLDYGSGLFRKLYANLYIELSERTPELWGFAYHESNREQSRWERELRQLYSRIGVYKFDDLNKLGRRRDHLHPFSAHRCRPVQLARANAGHAHLLCGDGLCGPSLLGAPRHTGHLRGQRHDPGHAGEPWRCGGEDSHHRHPGQPGHRASPKTRLLFAAVATWARAVITLIGSAIDDDKVRLMVTGLLAREIDGTVYVVAGRNETLEASLQGMEGGQQLQLVVLGFVDYLDDLIAASDLVISKSGGLITSEVMARGTPMLVVEPIRGQEEFNADFVVTAGTGVQARLTDSVPYMVESLVHDPTRLAHDAGNAQRHGRPLAATAIAEQVLAAIGARGMRRAHPQRSTSGADKCRDRRGVATELRTGVPTP